MVALKLTDRQFALYESYLDEMAREYRDWEIEFGAITGCAYQIKKEDGKYVFSLTDDFAKFVKETDHDCDRDGCSFCMFLIDLGLIPDRDDIDRDDKEVDSNENK